MRRRLIPPMIATSVLVVGATMFMSGFLDENTADKWLIGFCSLVFGLKTCLFWWMRWRMQHNIKGLTIFGLAITDWFLALFFLAATLTYIFAQTYYMIHRGEIVSDTTRTVNRTLIALAGVLVVTTGAAVAYEMRRAGENLAVHRENGTPVGARLEGVTSD